MTQKTPNLYGLILAGGFSQRMGQDKALLQYHGQPQFQHAFDLLLRHCQDAFVSARKEQEYIRLPRIDDHDHFKNLGPIGGILSAMTSYPNASWLILACDLPFVDDEALSFLIKGRNNQKIGTAFISTHDQLPEPLCAIWENHAKDQILQHVGMGIKCPRKILIKSNAHLLAQQNPIWLDNVNTPEEYKISLKKLR